MTGNEKIFFAILLIIFFGGLVVRDYFRQTGKAPSSCKFATCPHTPPVIDNPKSYMIDINQASVEELRRLAGITKKIALAITEYRKVHKFETPQDLKKIDGIDHKKYERIKDFIFVTK